MGGALMLPEDPQWCGHAFVSLRSWTCADCDRPVIAEMRARLEQAATRAPDGWVWVLILGDQEHVRKGVIVGDVEGVFTDRARIARILVRDYIISADGLRDVLRRTHWYQGAYNEHLFEGWEEEPDEHGRCTAYHLYRYEVDAGR